MGDSAVFVRPARLALVPDGASIYDVSFPPEPVAPQGGRPPAAGDAFADPTGPKRTGPNWAEQSRAEKNWAEQTGSKLSEIDLSSGWLLAQVAQAEATQGEAANPEAVGLFPQLPFPILIAIMFGLFYFLILRPQQNKDKKFRSMLEGLKEKDRVVTIGGIHGVVTNVQRDRDEVTVRVDESTGTKIRVGTSAITRVVSDEEKNDKKTS